MIDGASTTWCQVNGMARSVAFYKDVLGLTPLYESPYWTEFQLGTGKIALHPRLEAGDGPCGEEGKGWYVGVACSDISSLKSAVEAGGGRTYGYHQTPGGVVMTFTDPDGNPLQAMQAGSKLADIQGAT